MTRELWTDLDELEFQMGNMHGIAFEADKPTEKPISPKPTTPPRPQPKPEIQKKHIKRDGKK